MDAWTDDAWMDGHFGQSKQNGRRNILGFEPTAAANFNVRQRQRSMAHQRQDELLL